MDEDISPRRMSEEEKEGYRGITLSENGEEETRQGDAYQQNVRVHVWNTAELPWWKKAVTYGLIAAGVVAFLILCWFFLIGGLVIAGAFAVVYYLKKLLMK